MITETVQVFVPNGTPNEKPRLEALTAALEAANAIARERGCEIRPGWPVRSEWGEQDLGGEVVAGWTFYYSAVPL